MVEIYKKLIRGLFAALLAIVLNVLLLNTPLDKAIKIVLFTIGVLIVFVLIEKMIKKIFVK